MKVCTTKQLAAFYGCSEKNIADNFNNNADRFVKGVHFADGLLIGTNKHSGRDWLENSAQANFGQYPTSAATDG